MKDTQDIFVDEIRRPVNLGSYSIAVMRATIEASIEQMWAERHIDDTNSDTRFFIRCLIRGLRDLQK